MTSCAARRDFGQHGLVLEHTTCAACALYMITITVLTLSIEAFLAPWNRRDVSVIAAQSDGRLTIFRIVCSELESAIQIQA